MENEKYYEAYREGQITIIEGPQRSGKTLGMSILALEEHKRNKKEILTNIAYEDPVTKLNKIPFRPLNFFKLTMETIDNYINKCITIDELNFYLDSRGSMTKINRKFCQWLLQSKKMGINTYGTTHNLSYLDLRFRENFDYLIQPQMYYLDKEKTKPAVLILRWFNGPNQQYFRKTLKINLLERPDLLGLYNTRHVFNPFAEMEEHIQQEKKESKKKKKTGNTPLAKLVPEFLLGQEQFSSEGISP